MSDHPASKPPTSSSSVPSGFQSLSSNSQTNVTTTGPMTLGAQSSTALGQAISSSSGGSRPSVIQLVFREKAALLAAYMPFLVDGGLFVPTNREYRLGDDIYLLLSLPDDPQRYPVAGKVAWLTPGNASGGRTQGVGVRFPADEKTRVMKQKIEEVLGTSLSSSKPTQTL
jgi:type IV pilus assembly protein PilZ